VRGSGAQSLRRQADEAYADLYPILTEKREAGLKPSPTTSTAKAMVTRRGKPWNPMQVKLVLDRAARVLALA